MSEAFLEKQVLGCFINDNTLIQETNIRTNHFKESHHKVIYNAMVKLTNEGKSVDQISLMTECYSMMDELGGVDYIMGIKSKGNLENFETYERTLIEQYKDRAAEEALQSFLTKKDRSIPDLLQQIQEIDEEGVDDDGDVMDTLASLLNLPYEPATQDMTGIPSGIKKLDLMTGGWQNANSIIVGARPSMGKSAFMLKCLKSAAESGAIPIVISLEMEEESLLKRLICSVGNIAGFLAREPDKMQDGKKKDWVDAVGKISNWRFKISDKPMQTIQEIRAKVRKVKREFPDKRILVMIDYLTLIKNPGTFPSDHTKISDISARLKSLAKEYNCPVITLAQLSRGVESRPNKRPMMSDLRESGSIEQDMDVGIFLYRESYYDKELKDNTMELIIAKQREGPTGTVEVDYNRSTGVIKDK